MYEVFDSESALELNPEVVTLTPGTLCILSLLTFVSNNTEKYFANSEIHNINTWHMSNLHLPREHQNIYQEECTLQVLRFSTVFHGTSKYTLIIQEHLKRQ